MRRVVVLLLLAIGSAQAAEPVAVAVAKAWGLLGSWDAVCTSATPDVGVSYSVEPDGKLVYRNHVGTSDVLAAETNADGSLVLKIRFFKPVEETRVVVLQKTGDTIRPILNRDERNEYSVRDGVFVATGKATLPLKRCSS